jgi:hypothetical protein
MRQDLLNVRLKYRLQQFWRNEGLYSLMIKLEQSFTDVWKDLFHRSSLKIWFSCDGVKIFLISRSFKGGCALIKLENNNGSLLIRQTTELLLLLQKSIETCMNFCMWSLNQKVELIFEHFDDLFNLLNRIKFLKYFPFFDLHFA